MAKKKKKTTTAGEDLEKATGKAVKKTRKQVDAKLEELEEYIREEPLKAVTAAFLLGIFMGKVMK